MAAPGITMPPQADPFAPPSPDPPGPASAPPAWGSPGGGPGSGAHPGYVPPGQQRQFYGAAQPARPGSGLGAGIAGLLLALLGLVMVLALQIMIYLLAHSSSPAGYGPAFYTAEKVLSWVAVAAFTPATVLGAIGARKPKGGVAVAALIVCGLSAAIFSVPVW